MASQKNIDYLNRTKEQLKAAKAFYFTDFTGLSVQSLEKLRREIKKNKGDYIVLKNTLGYLAMKEMGYDEATIQKLFVGPTGVAIALDDPIVLAKVLTNAEELRIKGSFIEGNYFDPDEVTRFSKIPSKEILYSTIVGSLNILGNMVGVLEGIIRDFFYTVEAIQKKEVK